MPKEYTDQNYQPLPNKEAIIAFNGKTLLTSQSYLDVKAYEHALAFTVAGLMDEDLLKDVRDAIASALENGTDFRTFKRTLKPYLMAKGWLTQTLTDGENKLVAGSNRRLRTIYSTNLQTAYSAGQWERIQQTKEFLPYLQYMPSVSENPRLSHKRYYHLVRPVDDVIWQSIFPPNGWGCKCWVKQLTHRQAEKVGISDATPLEVEEYTNPKTGEVSDVPKGIDPSFYHNHDRLTALVRLANEKHGTAFSERLKKRVDDFTLDLIHEPDFTRGMMTVGGVEFAKRFEELKSAVFNNTNNKEIKDDKQIRRLEKDHAIIGNNYAVAIISPTIKQFFGANTNLVWLSEQTVVKTLARHSEQASLDLFKNISNVVKNAVLIVAEKKDLHVSYFKSGENMYQATIKSTQDKSELYVVTIFKTNADEIKRAKRNKEILFEKMS